MKFKTQNQNKSADGVPTQRRRIRDFDRVLTGGFILVAAAAASLPWYVFFNPEKFGISGIGWEALKNMPQRDGGGVDAVVPHVEEGLTSEGTPEAIGIDIDAVTTAAIATTGESEGAPENGNSQPFPAGTRFKLLHVSNGRALIEDKSGMFLVQIGSVLPDESRLISLNNIEGKWQIVTSAGEIYWE